MKGSLSGKEKKEKYPIYEAIKIILPEIDKTRVIEFIEDLLTHLKKRGLLFEGWQQQRDIRRKVKAEIRILLLSRFKEYKNKMDDLMDAVFEALERIKWRE